MTRPTSMILLVTAVTLFALPAEAHMDPPLGEGTEAKTWLEIGEAMEQQGNDLDAIVAYRRALQWEPGNAKAWNRLGSLLVLTRMSPEDIDEAEEAFRRAMDSEPSVVDYRLNLGNLQLNERRVDEAIATFREAVRIAPRSAAAHNRLGIALEEDRQVEAAIAAYRESIRLDPKDYAVRYRLGHALGKRRDWDGAAAAIREAIRLAGDQVDTHGMHFMLGQVLAEKGDLEGAVTAYREAARQLPESWAYRSELVRAEQELKAKTTPSPAGAR